MRVVQASTGRGRLRIEGLAIPTENGVLIAVFGGEKPHVGAIALAIPRPSLRQPQKISATTSTLTLTGHKDDEIAKPAAELAAKKLKVPAVAVAGVHVDKPRKGEIRKLVENSMKTVRILVSKLGDGRKLAGNTSNVG